MKIVKVNLLNPDKGVLLLAANVLTKGGLVVYPTDTSYGLGANAFDENSVVKCLYVKERSTSKPTHVVVKDWLMIKNISFVDQNAKRVYDKYFPGPITLILKKKDIVPEYLTGGLPTVGVRIPNCEVTKNISEQLKFPYTTTSANREGEPAPYSLQDLKKVLDLEKVDLVLDAGKLPHTPPSTILDLSTSNVKVLREGPIKNRGILKTLRNNFKKNFN